MPIQVHSLRSMNDAQLSLYSYLWIVLKVDDLIQGLVVVVVVVSMSRHGRQSQWLRYF